MSTMLSIEAMEMLVELLREDLSLKQSLSYSIHSSIIVLMDIFFTLTLRLEIANDIEERTSDLQM